MQEEYTYLFNTITDTIKRLEELRQLLVSAQQQAEQIYMERGE